MNLRRAAARILRPLRPGAPQAPPPWVVAQRQPEHPEPVDFRLFAIIGAWMEADVIAATVANAFTQGCEKVFLVDNDSADDTVKLACEAGAELAATFATEEYDEQLRLDIMNDVVAEQSARAGSEYVWWLWLDADEFPHGPRGLTIREYLTGLDRRFRIVGGRFFNHFPSAEPAYVAPFHPLDFQPLCEEHRMGCAARHRKHPLQRFDREGPVIVCDRGFHRAASEERPLLEPDDAIFVHHFPYREPDVTRRRLASLCGVGDDGRTRVREGDDAADGMVPRFQTLDAVYAGDWENVRNYRGDRSYSIARPGAWADAVSPEDQVVKRWYDIAAARRVDAPQSP